MGPLEEYAARKFLSQKKIRVRTLLAVAPGKRVTPIGESKTRLTPARSSLDNEANPQLCFPTALLSVMSFYSAVRTLTLSCGLGNDNLP